MAFKGSKRQAQTALAGQVAEVKAGVIAPSAKTVAALLEEWLHPHLAARPLPSRCRLPPSRGPAARRLKALPLKKVTTKVVDDLYRFLPQPASRKPATVLHFHTMLRAAFAQAVPTVVESTSQGTSADDHVRKPGRPVR